jgi:cell division protein FtsQ
MSEPAVKAKPTFRERLRRPGWKLLGALLLLGVVGSSPWWGRALLSRLAYFNLRHVEVRGVRYLHPSDVIARLKVDTTQSVWQDAERLEARLKNHRQIVSVSISRKLPSTIVVNVVENLPVALIPMNAGLVPFDTLGRALPIDPSREDVDLPVLSTRDTGALKLLGRLREAHAGFFGKISEVTRNGRDDLTLTLADLRIRVRPGVSLERLADIFPVQKDLERKGLRATELDLRYSGQVIARLQ